MNIVITGASGSIGRRVTALLLDRIPAKNLILVTRSPDALADASARGARVRKGDFDDRDGLEAAFAGGDRILIISGLAINRRVQQHRNGIEAAKRAGVQHVVYTSTAGIHPLNPTLSAKEHIVTEADLRASGLPYTILRNAMYAEVIATLMVSHALASGKWTHAMGEGKVAPVSKQDIARCAAACLLETEVHRNAVYEITGPELVSFRQIAAIASQVYRTPLEYVPISAEERYAIFDGMGIPRRYKEGMLHQEAHAWPSDEMVSAEVAISQNFFALLSHHVEFITGTPAVPLRQVFEACKGKSHADV